MSRYNEISVGDTCDITHKITHDDIKQFVNLSGDDNRLHVDKEYAAQTQFKKPVAHGMIGVSFISTIIGTKIPGDGALWYAQTLEFLQPVRVGDTIRITATVTKKIDRNQSIELDTCIYNQHRQKVTTGTAKVRVVEFVPEAKTEESQNTDSDKRPMIIIGATGGIGQAIAKQVAADGFPVVLHYFSNKKGATDLKKDIEKAYKVPVIIINGDIHVEADVQDMLGTVQRYYDQVGGLVNAATPKFGNVKFSDMQWEDIQIQFDAAIKASFLLVKAFQTLMSERKGSFVFFSSQAVEQTNTQWLHYITSKSALTGFVRGLALELAPQGIRINLVSPSMIDTELVSDIPEKVKLLTAAKTPLKRLGQPKDVAEAALFLLSDRASFITGETIRVNGGQVML